VRGRRSPVASAAQSDSLTPPQLNDHGSKFVGQCRAGRVAGRAVRMRLTPVQASSRRCMPESRLNDEFYPSLTQVESPVIGYASCDVCRRIRCRRPASGRGSTSEQRDFTVKCNNQCTGAAVLLAMYRADESAWLVPEYLHGEPCFPRVPAR
jgi:hypothetical protein